MVRIADAAELARLATLDLGVTVTADTIRAYMLIGERALPAEWTPEQRSDLFATVAKELQV